MPTRFATCTTFVVDTNFVSWIQKVFLKIFRNISCVRTTCNNVTTFCHRRTTLWDTMLPPVLVLPGPNPSLWRFSWNMVPYQFKLYWREFSLSPWHLAYKRGKFTQRHNIATLWLDQACQPPSSPVFLHVQCTRCSARKWTQSLWAKGYNKCYSCWRCLLNKSLENYWSNLFTLEPK